MTTTALKIALVGAESTGKTQLARELALHWSGAGWRANAVGEVLREWCDREGRTPRADEQMRIAQEQASRIDQAAKHADVVIADTTPLMIAIYSDLLFADRSILPMALDFQRGFDVSLLTGLDVAWIADGLQRDGPHVREPVDARIRAALQGACIEFKVIYGVGPARLQNALVAIQSIANNNPYTRAVCHFDAENWQNHDSVCEKCSDPRCERRLFARLLDRDLPD